MADHALTLRIDMALWIKLRDEAWRREISLSALIREALNEKTETFDG